MYSDQTWVDYLVANTTPDNCNIWVAQTHNSS